MDYSYLDRNASLIREKVAEVCREHGRVPESITLMAAVKSADAGEINYIHNTLGFNVIGENRVQQLLEHYNTVNREGLSFHFIGTLQTNKVKYIVDKVSMIQSLDSIKLALEINKRCSKISKIMDVLIEINSGKEENKSGVLPDSVKDLASEIQGLQNIRLRGFMTMAPRCSSDEEYRCYFGDTRRLCQHIWKDLLTREDDMVLSMGMSDSYLPAIAEGATLIRVGRGLFKKD